MAAAIVGTAILLYAIDAAVDREPTAANVDMAIARPRETLQAAHRIVYDYHVQTHAGRQLATSPTGISHDSTTAILYIPALVTLYSVMTSEKFGKILPDMEDEYRTTLGKTIRDMESILEHHPEPQEVVYREKNLPSFADMASAVDKLHGVFMDQLALPEDCRDVAQQRDSVPETDELPGYWQCLHARANNLTSDIRCLFNEKDMADWISVNMKLCQLIKGAAKQQPHCCLQHATLTGDVPKPETD